MKYILRKLNLAVILSIMMINAPEGAKGQIIISEYLEGASNDKCIELFNTTNAAINLTGYSLRRYTNGSTSATSIALTGTIPACGTYVVCNSSSQAALLALADQTSGSMTHNGDDAYDLFDGTSVLDVFGDIGCDPGSAWTSGANTTVNNGLIRNSNVCTGVSDPTGACNSSSFTTLGTEWSTTGSTSDFSDLGSHTTTCCGSSNTITTGTVTGGPFTVDCATTDAGTVDFTSTGTFNAANIYTAELSDASGSFTTPISIGTLASTANSGTINITIPAGTIAGTGYIIRVVSDDPAVTGTNSASFTINSSVTTGTLIMNEISNGASGAKEYFEMLVVGTACTEVNIQGLIFDDNNGDWGGAGIASGHYRFTTDPQWGCVPTGTIIVVYNDGDANASLPADDETDANSDNVFVLPISSTYVEACTGDPNTGSAAYNVGGCTYSSGGAWSALGMANSGDVGQTRDAAGNFVHGIGYGGTAAPAGGVDFGASGGGGDAFIFDNAIDDDYTDPNNFSFGAVASTESPGAANSAANATYIASFDCIVLPVEMLYFEVSKKDKTSLLTWETVSEENAWYFSVERSVDGHNWQEIGKVSANGNSLTNRQYEFVDENPRIGFNYYRLKQVDFNQSYQYTGIRAIKHWNNQISLDSYSYSEGNLFVRLNGDIRALDANLFDVSGKLIKNFNISGNTHTIGIDNLIPGVYILSGQSADGYFSEKIIIH